MSNKMKHRTIMSPPQTTRGGRDTVHARRNSWPKIQTHPLLQLQTTIGNQAVQRLLQAKLKISHPRDRYEREADRTAEQVLRMPEPRFFNQTAAPESSNGTRSQRPCPECKDEIPWQAVTLQANKDLGESQEGTSDVQGQLNAVRGGGQPLPEAARAFFEPRFGYDFSQVRVHSDANADALNHALNARAFTTGQDIFFRHGEYNPSGSGHRRLLAHELTHVVQQGSAGVRDKAEAFGMSESRSANQKKCAACSTGQGVCPKWVFLPNAPKRGIKEVRCRMPIQ
jgi:hypothetical protein